MDNIITKGNALYYMRKGELIKITACAKNAIRFQGFPSCREEEENYTLMPLDMACDRQVFDSFAMVVNGDLALKLNRDGSVSFWKNGEKLLEEQPEMTFDNEYRPCVSVGNSCWKTRVTFNPNENEHFYGLGHEPNNRFDLKGCSFDIRNINAKCTIPYVYSSLGYGFLWNSPGTGSVDLSHNRTRWSSDAARRIDYVVIAGSPAEVTATLADLTGHAPVMPHWATGFWQCRLRYETQEELLAVARRYHKEGIPLAVIIADYFHWTEQGNYEFDPKYWPDVRAMARELHEMGTKLVVSVWPTINENSRNYRYMSDNNLLIRTERGSDRVFSFYGWQAEIDATNPATREYVWRAIRENYIDNGVDGVWFDEAEPEIYPVHFDNLRFYMGRGDEVGLLFPYYYAKMAYDGLRQAGRDDIVTLTRCAYLGSQKFGALVWSGDIQSTFQSLACQVKAGLNMAMCGIPWWNTDIGGFYGGDTHSDSFKELIVRWFQYGVFCPVMRLHGNRKRHGEKSDLLEPSGDPNELWSFGDENFKILKDLVFLRERLRPYIEKHMKIASEKGIPVMRPMFFDFPKDEICYTLGEQYMFGDDILFAPVVQEGQTEKTVYLPSDHWILTMDRKEYHKGFHQITVPVHEFAAFVKKDAKVLSAF